MSERVAIEVMPSGSNGVELRLSVGDYGSGVEAVMELDAEELEHFQLVIEAIRNGPRGFRYSSEKYARVSKR
jgi:hypothetical protein